MHRRVDRKRLKRRLVDACIKGDTTLLTKRAVDVEGTAVEFDDGSSVRACVVVDACVEIKFTARSSTSTPSTRRLLDGLACVVARQLSGCSGISISIAFRVGRGGRDLAAELSAAGRHRCDDC